VKEELNAISGHILLENPMVEKNFSPWCVLKPGLFSIFEAEIDKEPLLSLAMNSNVQVIPSSNELSFELVARETESNGLLAFNCIFSTKAALTKWMNAVSDICEIEIEKPVSEIGVRLASLDVKSKRHSDQRSERSTSIKSPRSQTSPNNSAQASLVYSPISVSSLQYEIADSRSNHHPRGDSLNKSKTRRQ
jgi:hypothetical protein